MPGEALVLLLEDGSFSQGVVVRRELKASVVDDSSWELLLTRHDVITISLAAK